MTAIIRSGWGLLINLPLLLFLHSVVSQKGYPCMQHRSLPFFIPLSVSTLFQKKTDDTNWCQPTLMSNYTSWRGQKHRSHISDLSLSGCSCKHHLQFTLRMCIEFMWQGFGSSEGLQGWLLWELISSCPHVEQSQFQVALRWTQHRPKLSKSVMLVVPLW